MAEKGKQRGQIGKISASEASQAYLSARFARQFFPPFSPTAEPGPRLAQFQARSRSDLSVLVRGWSVGSFPEQRLINELIFP